MFGFLFKAPAWQLVAQADVMTKTVLLALFSLSVFCMWIVLNRFLVFWRQRKGMKALRAHLRKVRTFDELLAVGKRYQDVAGGRLLIKALSELKRQIPEKGAEKTKHLAKNIENMEAGIDQLIDQVLTEEGQYLPVLGTSAAVSPLVGLFGTVWGLVHAFVDISRHKSADLAVVAPGIAEALTTTLAGLMVSIPALVFFHYFSNELRKLEQQLWGVADKFIHVVKITFL